MKTKLSVRLGDIYNLINDSYEEVWDTCCDHGKLGLALLESNKCNKVHFVDQVPIIISKLKRKIDKIRDLEDQRYELHAIKAEDILINNKKSLICICGVGGDVAMSILGDILKSNDLSNQDLLISAQYHMYELRKFLKDNGFKTKQQFLSFEGKWSYELLLLSQGLGSEIDLVGADLIDVNDARHLSYLKKNIIHYKKCSYKNESMKEVLRLYENLLS